MITESEQIEEMRTMLDITYAQASDDVLAIYLKRAKNIYLRLVYPFERDVTELPDERAQDWQTKCAGELYLLKDKGNLSRYSENGLSEGYGKAGLSEDLLSELPPARGKVIG